MVFVGRRRELGVLAALLDDVRNDGEGRLVVVRGRRQVGKSRLVEEFLRTAGVPAVFADASGRGADVELDRFLAAVETSDLPAAEQVRAGVGARSWEGALRLTMSGATRERPLVVVLDEFPYLVGTDPAIEGTVQSVWDRVAARTPVLLVLVGSDLAMMEALTTYGRPLYGRVAREIVLAPFPPGELAALTGLEGAEAWDAAVVIGGFPLLARTWPRGAAVEDVLATALRDPTSPLLVSAERSLAAELPAEGQARAVLEAVGAGETTFTAISRRSGIAAAGLNRPLALLVAKGLVAAERPLAAGESRETRYRITDPYLRFWLRFLGPGRELVARDRGDLLLAEVLRGWPSYRGRAVEPLVRDALERLLPDARGGAARLVGGWWTRTNSVEVDLVGVDRRGTPRSVGLIGSVRWRERRPFDRADRAALDADAARVPGVTPDTPRVGVSRTGFADAGLDWALGAEELLAATA